MTDYGEQGNEQITIAVEKFIQRIENDSQGRPIYIGIARPGSATSAESWQIRKCSYSGVGGPVSILFANGNTNFTNIWDNRASYSYS